MPVKCETLMKTPVVCLSPIDSLRRAAVRMRDEEIGFLPVIDDVGRVLGALTDRDIVVRAVADRVDLDALRVADVMSFETVTCRPGDELMTAEQLMRYHRKSRIMVTDDRGVILGVISLSDVAMYEDPRESGRTLRRVASRETVLSHS